MGAWVAKRARAALGGMGCVPLSLWRRLPRGKRCDALISYGGEETESEHIWCVCSRKKAVR